MNGSRLVLLAIEGFEAVLEAGAGLPGSLPERARAFSAFCAELESRAAGVLGAPAEGGVWAVGLGRIGLFVPAAGHDARLKELRVAFERDALARFQGRVVPVIASVAVDSLDADAGPVLARLAEARRCACATPFLGALSDPAPFGPFEAEGGEIAHTAASDRAAIEAGVPRVCIAIGTAPLAPPADETKGTACSLAVDLGLLEVQDALLREAGARFVADRALDVLHAGGDRILIRGELEDAFAFLLDVERAARDDWRLHVSARLETAGGDDAHEGSAAARALRGVGAMLDAGRRGRLAAFSVETPLERLPAQRALLDEFRALQDRAALPVRALAEAATRVARGRHDPLGLPLSALAVLRARVHELATRVGAGAASSRAQDLATAPETRAMHRILKEYTRLFEGGEALLPLRFAVALEGSAAPEVGR